MFSRTRVVLAAAAVLVAAALPMIASASHSTFQLVNLVALGESPEPASFLDEPPLRVNSDLAFSGDLAFQGSYDGYRIVDISSPDNPTEIADVSCNGNQGDVIVYGDIVIRTVDRPQRLPDNDLSRACEGVDTEQNETGFEGLQIFDVGDFSNASAADLVAAVPTDCGAHTATLAPDLANDRLIVYVSTAFSAAFQGPTPYGTTCVSPHDRIVAVAIPLSDPAHASVINNRIPASHNGCHDVAVHLGVQLLVGACRPEAVVWNIADPVNPVRLYGVTNPGVTSWHSASLTWDGNVFIMGWEPGGGSAPRCLETGTPLLDTPDPHDVQTDEMKSLFFYRVSDGTFLGMWTLPRPQTAEENCTIHNYNVVPLHGRYVLVHGSYQSGTSMVDFTDPANATEVAFADPPPLVPTQLGGSWSSYWYNGLIYESDITRGLAIYGPTGLAAEITAQAWTLDRLNPQTQEFSIG
jgi:hypothetical protein